jgi:excisionase family DNA binding protein
MTEDYKKKPYLTPNEVAQWMMVSPITVRSWAQRGLLQAEVTPGGHRRFRLEEVERFARQWNPAGNKGPQRILIVDDNKAFAGFLMELLGEGEQPMVVEAAYDGFDAGRKVHTFSPDIVLLDLMMPGIKGTEVCRQIKNTGASQCQNYRHERISEPGKRSGASLRRCRMLLFKTYRYCTFVSGHRLQHLTMSE